MNSVLQFESEYLGTIRLKSGQLMMGEKTLASTDVRVRFHNIESHRNKSSVPKA